MTRRAHEDLVVEYSRRLHARGFVANHDGNVSVRLEPERFLITPTAVSKAAVTREMLLVVDGEGKVVSGTRKPFGEIDLHLFIYRERPDARAVLHAHPPTATGFAVAGVPVRSDLLPEPVVSLGDRIPLVPYARPRSAEATLGMRPHLGEHDVLVLENHGVIAFGPDLETAYLRLELVEHLARIQLAAMQAGGLRAIPESDVRAMLDSRTRAGLGAKGRARTS